VDADRGYDDAAIGDSVDGRSLFRLAVTVKDANGVVIPNISVTFQAPRLPAASGKFANNTTTTLGEHEMPRVSRTATAFTANSTAGGPYNRDGDGGAQCRGISPR